MRFLTVRRLALAALVPALLVFSVVPGCSNQSEGERCGDDTGALDNDDCQDGLVCTPVIQQGTTYNRCCNPNRSIINDSRCENTSGNVTPDAGTGDSAIEAGGTSGEGGTSAAAGGGGQAGASVTEGGAAGAVSANAGAAGSN